MKKTLFALLPVSIFLFFSCGAGGVYLGTEAPFTVLTGLDSNIQAEGTVLIPGSRLVPSISGTLPESLASTDLHVILAPVSPLDETGRAVISRYEEQYLARYTVGEEDQADIDGLFDIPTAEGTVERTWGDPQGYEEDDGSLSAADEDDSAALTGTDTEEPAADAGEVADGGPLDPSDESAASPNESVVTDGDTSYADEELAGAEEVDPAAAEDVGDEGQTPVFEPADYRIESLEDELASFLIPEGLEPGPWVITYAFIENGSVQESVSFRFLCLPQDSFTMDSLVAYPPGPDSPRQPVLPAGSMALFELSGRAPQGIEPVVRWYMAGEDLEETAFVSGRSRLLHQMPQPDEEGVYSLKAEVYPLDPDSYPDFPLRPLVKTLALAVSLEEKTDDIAALDGSDVALFFPLRGSLEAKNRADVRLQAGSGAGSPEWVPLKNDFGLLAGPQAPWYLDSTIAQLPSLSSKPLRFLLDAAIHDDGQLGGGSIVLDDARTLNWRLSAYGQAALFTLTLSGEADPLVLVLEGARSDTRSRQWYTLDFELASQALHVRARAGSGAEAVLSLPLPDAGFRSWGPLHLGSDPLSGEVKLAEAVIYHLACASIQSFYGEIAPEPANLDESGEQFLEI